MKTETSEMKEGAKEMVNIWLNLIDYSSSFEFHRVYLIVGRKN